MPKRLRDRAQSVVAVVAAAELQSHGTERQVQLVVDDDQAGWRAPCRTSPCAPPGHLRCSCSCAASPARPGARRACPRRTSAPALCALNFPPARRPARRVRGSRCCAGCPRTSGRGCPARRPAPRAHRPRNRNSCSSSSNRASTARTWYPAAQQTGRGAEPGVADLVHGHQAPAVQVGRGAGRGSVDFAAIVSARRAGQLHREQVRPRSAGRSAVRPRTGAGTPALVRNSSTALLVVTTRGDLEHDRAHVVGVEPEPSGERVGDHAAGTRSPGPGRSPCRCVRAERRAPAPRRTQIRERHATPAVRGWRAVRPARRDGLSFPRSASAASPVASSPSSCGGGRRHVDGDDQRVAVGRPAWRRPAASASEAWIWVPASTPVDRDLDLLGDVQRLGLDLRWW